MVSNPKYNIMLSKYIKYITKSKKLLFVTKGN